MKSVNALAIATLALGVVACDRARTDTSASADPSTSVVSQLDQSVGARPVIVPPAPPERGPIPPNANAAAPGTDASLAFAGKTLEDLALPPEKGGLPGEQHVTVAAQDAAAKVPDTTSADAAKREVRENATSDEERSSGSADMSRDISASAPHAELTPGEEANSMPKAGQANDHSSTALEPNGER